MHTLLETRIRTKIIHGLLKFNQSQWLKPHIEFNTQRRIEANMETKMKSKLLFTDTDSLMYERKKEMFDFNNYSTKSKYCNDTLD